MPAQFDLLGKIEQVQNMASGRSVRARRYLNARLGPGRWRKMKGIAAVPVPTGEIFTAEIHWYEAHGIGKRDFKIKKRIQ